MTTDPYFGITTVAAFVRKWMEIHGYSQAGLAETLKVSKPMVNFVVRSDEDSLNLPFIKKLYRLLNSREKEVVRTILYHVVTKDLK